jgi:hypothetical protein
LLKNLLETINEEASLLKDPPERIMPTKVAHRSKPSTKINERRYPAWINHTALSTPPKQITMHSTENNEFTPLEYRDPQAYHQSQLSVHSIHNLAALTNCTFFTTKMMMPMVIVKLSTTKMPMPMFIAKHS